MAVIATRIAPNGATVMICDDCMATKGSEEEARIIEWQQREARNILMAWAAKHGADGKETATA